VVFFLLHFPIKVLYAFFISPVLITHPPVSSSCYVVFLKFKSSPKGFVFKRPQSRSFFSLNSVFRNVILVQFIQKWVSFSLCVAFKISTNAERACVRDDVWTPWGLSTASVSQDIVCRAASVWVRHIPMETGFISGTMNGSLTAIKPQ